MEAILWMLLVCYGVFSRAVNQKVLLISLDGFRWDFINKTSTPNFDWIVEHGVSVEYVQNVFPTLTLPNHQSIVTGLYPENHGMISNDMYDKNTQERFSLELHNPSNWWNQSVPIWIENERQGHKSGVCFWPGYDVAYDGTKPTYLPPPKYTYPFANTKNKMPIVSRVEVVMDWLKKNASFTALYVEKIDDVVHKYGPDRSSAEVNKSISQTDRVIGRVKERLAANHLDDQVNVIVIGDHGSVDLSYKKVIKLNKFVNLQKYSNFISGRSYVMIYPRGGFKRYIYEKLKRSSKGNHFKVFLKGEIPDKYHIKHSNRTGEILVIGEPGWTFLTNDKKEWFNKNNDFWMIGDHGYSNFEKNMNPSFLAYGPLFRSNYRRKSVDIIDLYVMMCHILKLNPNKNDGNFDHVKDMFKEYSQS